MEENEACDKYEMDKFAAHYNICKNCGKEKKFHTKEALASNVQGKSNVSSLINRFNQQKTTESPQQTESPKKNELKTSGSNISQLKEAFTKKNEPEKVEPKQQQVTTNKVAESKNIYEKKTEPEKIEIKQQPVTTNKVSEAKNMFEKKNEDQNKEEPKPQENISKGNVAERAQMFSANKKEDEEKKDLEKPKKESAQTSSNVKSLSQQISNQLGPNMIVPQQAKSTNIKKDNEQDTEIQEENTVNDIILDKPVLTNKNKKKKKKRIEIDYD